MQFLSLGLGPEPVRAVSKNCSDAPTAMQAKINYLVRAGRDWTGSTQNGARKTAVSTLPMLQRVAA